MNIPIRDTIRTVSPHTRMGRIRDGIRLGIRGVSPYAYGIIPILFLLGSRLKICPPRFGVVERTVDLDGGESAGGGQSPTVGGPASGRRPTLFIPEGLAFSPEKNKPPAKKAVKLPVCNWCGQHLSKEGWGNPFCLSCNCATEACCWRGDDSDDRIYYSHGGRHIMTVLSNTLVVTIVVYMRHAMRQATRYATGVRGSRRHTLCDRSTQVLRPRYATGVVHVGRTRQ